MGGAVDSHGSYGNYINCTFIDNSAVFRGGAMGFLVGHDNNILDCTFINNTSPVGGAIYLVNTGSKLMIKNSKFINNSAQQKGGAVYNDADMEINQSDFFYI